MSEAPKKLRYKDLLMNLIRESNVLSELFQENERYVRLLQELEKYDIDDNEPLPSQKDLLERLDMSRTQLMKLMQGLYQDFHERLFKPNAYPITDTEVWLYIKTRDDYWPIGIKVWNLFPEEERNLQWSS